MPDMLNLMSEIRQAVKEQPEPPLLSKFLAHEIRSFAKTFLHLNNMVSEGGDEEYAVFGVLVLALLETDSKIRQTRRGK